MSSADSVSSRFSRRQFLGKGLFAGAIAGLGAAKVNGGATATAGPAAVSDKPGYPVGDAMSGGMAGTGGIAARYEALKKSGDRPGLYRFLYAFPKGGDLHHHLGGGILPSTWYAVATDPKKTGGQRFFTRTRISTRERLPFAGDLDSRAVLFWTTVSEQAHAALSPELQADFKPLDALNEFERKAWMESVYLDKAGEGRTEFFEYIWSRLNHLLRSIHVVSAACVENMKLFGAEGVRYMELQTGFFGWHDNKDNVLSAAEATVFWKSVLNSDTARATGVTVRFQDMVLRFADTAEERVERAFAALDTHRDLWVGINMAGREDDNRGYPRRFTDVYDRMLRRYSSINISIHAGEAEKADSNIFDTLRLGASRIGHAINLIHDEPTMLLLRGSNKLMEINLISNELLGYVPDLDTHPFPIYLRQGIPCCLNTDDRGMWHSNHTDEFFVAVTRYNLSWDELTGLARNSLEYSFAQPGLKAALVKDWESDLAGFIRRFEKDDFQRELGSVPAVTHEYGHNRFNLNT